MTSNAEEPLLEADEVMPAREVFEHTVRRPRILQGLFSSAPSLELTVLISSRRPGFEISRHQPL